MTTVPRITDTIDRLGQTNRHGTAKTAPQSAPKTHGWRHANAHIELQATSLASERLRVAGDRFLSAQERRSAPLASHAGPPGSVAAALSVDRSLDPTVPLPNDAR